MCYGWTSEAMNVNVTHYDIKHAIFAKKRKGSFGGWIWPIQKITNQTIWAWSDAFQVVRWNGRQSKSDLAHAPIMCYHGYGGPQNQ